jgi:hypothetical protein
VKLSTRLHLVPSSKNGVVTPLADTPSWRGAQLMVTFDTQISSLAVDLSEDEDLDGR